MSKDNLFTKQLPSFPGGTSGKEPACQSRRDIRDAGLTPGSGRSSGGGHGNPLQDSCLENLMGSQRVGHD